MVECCKVARKTRWGVLRLVGAAVLYCFIIASGLGGVYPGGGWGVRRGVGWCVTLSVSSVAIRSANRTLARAG